MSRRGSTAKTWTPYKGATVRGLRFVAYIRVSRMDKDGEKISPEVQLNEITRHVEGLGGTIVAVIEDLDLSGRESKKRQLNVAIDMVEGGKADGVAVWKISRWGRNHMDSMKHILDLEHVGGYITSATENLNDIHTPMGSFSLTIMLAIAQLQSDQIGETWANIQTYRVEKKKLPATGGARFGYTYHHSKGKSDPGSYTIEPESAKALKECYERYVRGDKMGSIVTYLRDGVKLKTSRGTDWTFNTLQNALDSGFAAGLIVRGNTKSNQKYWTLESRDWVPGGHEAIIDEDLWDAYLDRRRRPGSPRTKSAPYRLAGLIHCGGCGRPMVLNHRYVRKNGTYLLDDKGEKVRKQLVRCYLLAKSVHTKTCPAPATMHMDRVEEAVMAWLNGNRKADDYGVEMAKRAQESERIEVDLNKLNRDLIKAEARLQSWLDQKDSGEISDRAYKVAERNTEAEMVEIEKRILEAKKRKRVNKVPRIDAMQGLFLGWDKLKPEQFNEGLRQVVAKIYVGRADAPGALARTRGIGGAVRVAIVPQWEEDTFFPASEDEVLAS